MGKSVLFVFRKCAVCISSNWLISRKRDGRYSWLWPVTVFYKRLPRYIPSIYSVLWYSLVEKNRLFFVPMNWSSGGRLQQYIGNVRALPRYLYIISRILFGTPRKSKKQYCDVMNNRLLVYIPIYVPDYDYILYIDEGWLKMNIAYI